MTFNRVSIHGRTFGGIVDAEGNELEKEEVWLYFLVHCLCFNLNTEELCY